MTIEGLKGEYCPDCTTGLTYFGLARYSIIPMCRQDLHEFLTNGDMDRVEKMIDDKENQECFSSSTIGENIDGRSIFKKEN